MKILLTGKNGQLGSVLERDLKLAHEVFATDRFDLDLANLNDIKNITNQIKPDLIINTAAYTRVDDAEINNVLANEINALGPKALSEEATILNIPIIHFSTDYIFDGLKKEDYKESDRANPLSVYGKTKWLGEVFVRQNPKHFILRTSWVFSSHGNNFLKTILKIAKEKTSIDIVNDQWGTPTSVKTLSKSIQVIISRLSDKNISELYGTYHISCKGKTTWYQYTNKILFILEFLGEKKLLEQGNVNPILSYQYPQKASRPKNSTLNTEKFSKVFMLEFDTWESEVEEVLREILRIN